MGSDSVIPTQGLTIYLVKEEFTHIDSVITGNSGLVHFSIDSGKHQIGDLYVQHSRPQPPRWAKFFRGHVEPGQLGQIASAGAVLLMSARDRLFAITFGHGRHLLNPDSWEERFGLRVALNSIGENTIRSIDKRTFDSISRHSREQASREASARDFQLDVEQDLLRAITGTPTDSDLGLRMSGMDALHTAIPTDVNSLRDLLSIYLAKYLDTTYLSKFPWVDHISEVSKRAAIDHLDEVLVQRIISGQLDGIWMAVPEVLEWQRVDGFQWAGHGQPLRNDIHLDGFLESIKDVSSLNVKTLKHKKVNCLDDGGVVFESWQAYRCVHAQIDFEGV